MNDCDQQKSKSSFLVHIVKSWDKWLIVLIDKCNDAQKSAQVKDFNTAVASTNIGPDPDFPDFDLICEG